MRRMGEIFTVITGPAPAPWVSFYEDSLLKVTALIFWRLGDHLDCQVDQVKVELELSSYMQTAGKSPDFISYYAPSFNADVLQRF